MITIEKLKEYEQFRGDYDGFYSRKIRNGTNLNNDDEWYIIADLCQDIRFMQKDLAAQPFIDNLRKKVDENCSNDDTKKYLEEVAAKGY